MRHLRLAGVRARDSLLPLFRLRRHFITLISRCAISLTPPPRRRVYHDELSGRRMRETTALSPVTTTELRTPLTPTATATVVVCRMKRRTTDGRAEGSILVATDAQPRVGERKAAMRGGGGATTRRRQRRRRRQQQRRKDCLRITNTTDGWTAYPLVFRSIHAAAAALMMLMLLCSVQSGAAVPNTGKERS